MIKFDGQNKDKGEIRAVIDTEEGKEKTKMLILDLSVQIYFDVFPSIFFLLFLIFAQAELVHEILWIPGMANIVISAMCV